MTTLILGVIDVPYVDTEEAKSPKARVKKYKSREKRSITGLYTGDVAEILEAKYGVMQAFFDYYQKEIAADLEISIKQQVENMLLGAPPQPDPFAAAVGELKHKFSKFLSERIIEGLGIEGVPTQAALNGVSHRFKKPYAKRASRPSFIDTGLYEASFIAEFKQ